MSSSNLMQTVNSLSGKLAIKGITETNFYNLWNKRKCDQIPKCTFACIRRNLKAIIKEK